MDAAFGGVRASRVVAQKRSLLSDQFRIELREVSAGRTRLSAYFLRQLLEEEVDGDFAEIVAAFREGACVSAQGVTGEDFELFRWRERAMTLRVTPSQPGTPPMPVERPQVLAP